MTPPGDPTRPSPAVLEFCRMTKRFGSVVACNDVDLAVHRGEIHGLLGENGAGKSTLMNMLIGLTQPDSGTIRIDGERCRIVDPMHAAEYGIGMVHQHYSLVDALTVWENVVLGERGRWDPRSAKAAVITISQRYGLDVDPDSKIGDLPAGIRQRVEIIKCLHQKPRIIVLDEPTAVLTPSESEHLFDVLRQGVDREGWSVVLVSHKLEEVLRATDRITIMRNGRVVERVMTGDADAASLARSMVGRPVSLRTTGAAIGMATEADEGLKRAEVEVGSVPTMEISDARVRASDGEVLLAGLSLRAHAGEILGVAGVEGNGQQPLSQVLSSLLALDSGTVTVDGTLVRSGVAGEMAEFGIEVIPADRHLSGCVTQMSVAENLILSSISDYFDGGVLQRDRMMDRAVELIDEFDIRTPGPDTPVGQLSGGNQQRVVLAQALSASPKILVAAQPTRGLDVGALEYISDRLQRAADDGVAVLLISTDLGEIAALADRIVVLFRGAIIGEMPRAGLDFEKLGLLIGGSTLGHEVA